MDQDHCSGNLQGVNATVPHIKNVISGVLNKALDDELIQANPAHRLGKIFKARDRKETIDPMTSEELRFLLNAVQKLYLKHYTLFLLVARTGMRIGEALGLQWSDLDYAGRFICVKRSLVRGRISIPKNGKERRTDMSLQLAGALRAHELESKKKGLALGLGGIPECVFTNEKGGQIDKDIWRRRVFCKVLQRAGLRRVRIHDLRHTYATLRISKGDNIADVSNQLGYHSPKLTWDVYYHWILGKKKSEVDALDDQDFLHPSAPYTHPPTKKELTNVG